MHAIHIGMYEAYSISGANPGLLNEVQGGIPCSWVPLVLTNLNQ